jgi:hypothetical protein
LGEKKWLKLGGQYTTRFHSSSYNLADIGLKLPLFLNKNHWPEKWEWLARLEILIWRSFHEKISPPPNLEAYQSVSESSRFEFQRTVFFFSSPYTCGKAWLDRKEKSFRRAKEYLVVYRKDFSVSLDLISGQEYRLLSRLKQGETFGAALRYLKKGIDSATLSSWLQRWWRHDYILRFS